jgi:hypothetical protein
MPHRNINIIHKLDESIRHLTSTAKEKYIILAGDFNCPDIDWPNLIVKKGATDRDVQQALVDLSIEHRLTQVHDQPTRNNNILDLVFTNNPSLVKTSSSVPGISDHAMVVTDIDIIPQKIKQKPRKIFIFSKANWDSINEDMQHLSATVVTEAESKDSTIQSLWDTLKAGIEKSINKHVPSKMSKKLKSLPWLNNNLKRMIRRKSRLYKHAKKVNNGTPSSPSKKNVKRHIRKPKSTTSTTQYKKASMKRTPNPSGVT